MNFVSYFKQIILIYIFSFLLYFFLRFFVIAYDFSFVFSFSLDFLSNWSNTCQNVTLIPVWMAEKNTDFEYFKCVGEIQSDSELSWLKIDGIFISLVLLITLLKLFSVSYSFTATIFLSHKRHPFCFDFFLFVVVSFNDFLAFLNLLNILCSGKMHFTCKINRV